MHGKSPAVFSHINYVVFGLADVRVGCQLSHGSFRTNFRFYLVSAMSGKSPAVSGHVEYILVGLRSIAAVHGNRWPCLMNGVGIVRILGTRSNIDYLCAWSRLCTESRRQCPVMIFMC